MHVRIEKSAAWLGPVMLCVIGALFWFVAGLVPPLKPSDTAEEIAAIYSDNAVRIRIGLALIVMVAFLLVPFFALISRQVRRIEGYWGVLSVSQIIASVVIPLGTAGSVLFGATAAYRPERSPDVTQALNDIFWFIFIGFIGSFIFQTAVLGFAVFIDRREIPSFPRWFGYYNIWVAVLIIPAIACFWFKTGPLAWNGLFAWWLPLIVFASWIFITTAMLLKAVDIEAAEREAKATEQAREPAA